ncbi:MAG: hypothetical protein E7496_03740 [Ruminococcus sp.]|nr:hypothetical protein [Ruminococcus sp.]
MKKRSCMITEAYNMHDKIPIRRLYPDKSSRKAVAHGSFCNKNLILFLGLMIKLILEHTVHRLS